MERKTSTLSFSIESILYGRPNKSKVTEEIRRNWKYCNQSCGIMDPQPCSIRGCCQECLCISDSYSDRIQSAKHRNCLEDHEGKSAFYDGYFVEGIIARLRESVLPFYNKWAILGN